MDELDKAILRELCQGSVQSLVWPDFRLSARTIGRKLRVPPGTVRNRIARWKRSGFLKGTVLSLNPVLFNLHAGMLTLEASPSIPRAEVIERLSKLDYIFTINTHVGNWVAVAFLYGSEASRKKKVDLISMLCGAKDSKLAEVRFPSYRGRLSSTDWKIVERLQSNAAEPYPLMAAALKVSARTIRRRVERMVREGAITAIASTDIRGIKNEIFAHAMIEHRDPATMAEVDRNLHANLVRYLWVAGSGDSYSVFLLNLPSIVTAREILEKLKTLDGVEAARVEILEERVELYDRLRDNVAERLESIRGREVPMAAR